MIDAMKVLLCGLVLAVCAAVAPVATATRGSEQLTITVRGGDFGDRLYTLGCDPATGTVRKPAAACATLHAHPDLLEPHPGQDHSCPPGTPTFEIAGTSGGAAVAASFSACVSGQADGLAAWERLVPYTVPALRGHPVLKLDAGVGPVRLGQRVETVEHGAHGQLLGGDLVIYRFGAHGSLLVTYGSDLRINRIEPNSRVDLGRAKVKRWWHFDCRPGRVYRHTTGAKWTAVLVEPKEPKSGWTVTVGAGAPPRTCDELSLASLHGTG